MQGTPYSGEHDLAEVQAALASWIHQTGESGYCYHIGDVPHRLFNSLRGRYPVEQMMRIWRDGETIHAFAIVSPRHSWHDALVSPRYRETDLEDEALTWGYTTARAWVDGEGRHSDPIVTDVHDGDHQRAALLARSGYVTAAEPWMYLNKRSLDIPIPDATLPDGFHIRGVTGEEDAEQLSAVHSGAFGSDWTPDLYRDEVMRKPGYHPELERVVVAPDGTFAAFCIIWLDTLNGTGLFEPVGTHERYHRKGLGRALLTHGLHLMQDRGMRVAEVGSETDNPASSGLYRSLGFSPYQRISSCVRQ